MKYDLIIIGSGPAGQKAAIAAAKLDKHVALIERKFSVGGVSVHRGTIPSKTLREAVSYLSGMRMRELYGSAYRVKERISMEDLSFRTQRVIEREVNVVRDQLLRNYVEIVPGTGSFEGPNTVRVESEDEGTRTLEADKLMIAVGSRPTRPTEFEFDDEKIIDSDGLLKMKEIPKSMTFVGSGVIGCEYATIFRAAGCRVTLIDGRRRPLDFIDDGIEDDLYYHLRDDGITVRFGESVKSITHTDDDRVRVAMDSGKELKTDACMFAAGRRGAVGSLNLEAVGLTADKRGRLKVNDNYQTEVEHIYAVGDIIGFPSLASTSMEQGRLAALHALGQPLPQRPSSLPFGIYTIPEISMVGPTEEELTAQSVPYEVGIARFRELARVQISGGRDGLLKLIFHRETLDLIAVHIIGQNATDLVHIGQAVIDHGGKVTYLRDTVFNFPTLAEAYKTAALNGLNKL